MKWAALLVLSLLVGCSSVDASYYRDPRTGAVETGCGPMQGFAFAIDRAAQGCDQSFKSEGWTKAGPS